MQRLSQLAEIGREGRAGAHRPGLSAAEQEACELVATWLGQEGLEVSWDGCGNLYGRLAGSDPAGVYPAATGAKRFAGRRLTAKTRAQRAPDAENTSNETADERR